MGICDAVDAPAAEIEQIIIRILTAPLAFTLMAWSSVLRLPVLSHFPRLSDLIHRFEFRLDPSNGLPAIPPTEYCLLTPLPRPLPWIITLIHTTRPSPHLLPLPRLPLVVHMRLIQLLRLRNLLMQIPLPDLPRSTALSLSDPRKTLLILRLPLLEPPAAIRSRELSTALSFDELDVVSSNTVALDELFLLLVPSHLFSFPLIQECFVPCEVKCSVPSLFNERRAILERVSERAWDQIRERCVMILTHPFSVSASFWT